LIILEGMGSIYSYFLEVCRGEKHNVSQKNWSKTTLCLQVQASSMMSKLQQNMCEDWRANLKFKTTANHELHVSSNWKSNLDTWVVHKFRHLGLCWEWCSYGDGFGFQKYKEDECCGRLRRRHKIGRGWRL
jgi:hypothetical protein